MSAKTAPYTLRLLGHADIGPMIALSNRHGERQVVQRTRETLKAHFAAGGIAVGVTCGGRLVAKALVKPARTGASMPGLAVPRAPVAVIGGVVVDSCHRGKGLMGALIDACLDHAAATGHAIAHARVRTGNEGSQKGFASKGFYAAAQGPSPDEPEHNVVFMYRSLPPVRHAALPPAKAAGKLPVPAQLRL